MQFGDFKEVRFNSELDKYEFVDGEGTVRSMSSRDYWRLTGVDRTKEVELKQSSCELEYISAKVKTESRLVAFLYTILRDHLTSGKVAGIVQDINESVAEGVREFELENGWEGRYAEDVARYLLEDGTTFKSLGVEVGNGNKD
jgi:hypothetical protein